MNSKIDIKDTYFQRVNNNTENLERFVWKGLMDAYSRRKDHSYDRITDVCFQMQIIPVSLVSTRDEGKAIVTKHNNKHIDDVIAFYVPYGNPTACEPFFLSRLVDSLKCDGVYIKNCTVNGSLYQFSIKTEDLKNTTTKVLTLEKTIKRC